jgi:hypothetical protein
MTQLALTDGSYQARSVIASAQRCVNLYPEVNQLNKTLYYPEQQTNSIITHYPTPGLRKLSTIGSGPIRGLYTASNNVMYCVSGAEVYRVDSAFSGTLMGTIDAGTTPVSMCDNTIDLVIVDGTTNGYTVTLADNTFAKITDAAFYGSDRVDYIDTFLIFNKPGTPQFYSSNSVSVTFDPLYFADKTAKPDYLVSAVVMHDEIWLIGEQTTEVWYNSGGADFPFSKVPGAFMQHGCMAKNSIAVQNLEVFWLSQNPQGERIVLMGTNYEVQRVSTHAIEHDISAYPVADDAIGFIYQQEGHQFYVLIFPSANRTWVFDTQTLLWHERMYLNGGVEERIRANCAATYQGEIVVGDYANGNIYAWDLDTYTDDGQPIQRIRSFPTLQNELKRTVYRKFLADMEVGDAGTGVTDVDVNLRYSDTGGQSWSDFMSQTAGLQGEYLTNMQWLRLGLGRRRVFELQWSAPIKTALNGAYIDIVAAAS